MWEQDIDTLKISDSYYITKLVVRIFNNDYYLSLPSTGSKVTKIEDIGKIVEESADMMEPSLEGVSIVAVKEIQQFKACRFCKEKIGDIDSSLQIGTCEKCKTTQKIDKCVTNEMAKLVVESPEMQITTLIAYADILQHILKLTQQSLLKKAL